MHLSWSDSKSWYDALHSKKNVLEKCLRIDIALFKEFIDKSFTEIYSVPSQNQLANVLKKKVASSKELNALSKEFFDFNRIFTILCSVIIVALIYSLKICVETKRQFKMENTYWG